jgi:hypothetical protein
VAGNSLPDGFRLIDVENYSIIRAKDIQGKAHEKARYCALSYVWGSTERFASTTQNLQELSANQALKGLNLPKTIMDSIRFCQEIGCKFLWVDSLCIVQDDEESKQGQIDSMDVIYSHAYLAIIAAAGDNADTGIPPFGSARFPSNHSLVMIQTSKGTLAASLSPQIASDEIASSTWSSRGWTLQEYALSRRVLFLTGSFVFFRCAKRLFCEDFGHGWTGFSNLRGDNLAWDLPVPPFYRQMQDPHRHYTKSFSALLANYVGRNLRYEKDILAAFTGILLRTEWSIGRHVWGLPSKEFGTALQWYTHMPFPCERREGFPSWSWTGWIHKSRGSLLDQTDFRDMYEGFDHCTADISAVSCCIVEERGQIRLVEESSLYNISQVYKSATGHKKGPFRNQGL